ncbi:acetyl-CoA synthetase [Desulfosarcina widdelii]|uniref:Acetyl-CoA synthetase n=1 Tax=Desulfosarcina widdelii TaxID=947919 RepID=A0A5K7Z137_9BACT|nr:AMP-binding protein [Desulfosarcina widdelii]BBO74618.1 acetyl-CoA synthetase [Desulfosarcina widdelii]
MKKIDKHGCYYHYDNKYDSWDSLCENFKWEIPVEMNAAFYVCDAHADDKSKVAIFHEDFLGNKEKFTFWQMRNITNQLANYLSHNGVKPGDRVAICMSQRPETLFANIAIWKTGAVSVPLTVLFGPDGLEYRLKHSAAKVAIVEVGTIDTLRSIKTHISSLKQIIVVGDAEMQDDEVTFDQAIEGMPKQFQMAVLNADDNLVLIYTGGTTGDPKGVIQKHAYIFRGPGHFAALCNGEIRPGDVFWNPADFAWTGPLFDLAFPALFYGKPLLTYMSGGKFEAEKAFQLIQDYGLSILYIPPTALRMMRQVENPEQKYALKSLRVLASGAESFGEALPKWVSKTFGSKTVVHEMYGQSEATLLTVNCQRYFEYKFNIGKAVPGLKVEILDKNGSVLPPGNQGEIAVASLDGNPVVMKEYWKNPQATKEKFKGNWMLTGDLGVKDADGYFVFVSRKDDIIISSGYRIGPSEIEDILTKHEAVLEAAVIGIPNEVRGEIPKAFIVLREGFRGCDALKAELKTFVKQRLAKHEYPREVDFLSELPKTTTGKVKRRDLREREGP